MAIQFIVRKGRDLRDAANTVYQGRVKTTDHKDTMSFAGLIADQSSATVGDVIGVIANLVFVMKTLVMDSQIVELGEFGNFRLTIKSGVTDTEAAWKPEQIRGGHIVFHPGKQLRMAYDGAQFKPAMGAIREEDLPPTGEVV